ncbi:MAG: serine/threonine-protein kinase [Victivallales bacterium]
MLKIFCHSCRQKLDVTNLKAFDEITCPTCGVKLIVPKWFNTYLLEQKCGAGGAAIVYRSLDLTLDREIAIKIFEECDNSPEFSKIFLHEGRIAASLNHRSIVPIYSCGQFEGRCFLIMQYMSKGSLKEQVKQHSPLKIAQVLTWILDITSALDAAFKAGVIHHDVKPANILLDSGNNAKLTDFGLSYALHDVQSQDLLSELSSYGSPDYVSPEKLIDGFEDEKGDVFSLGVTLYELLTAGKPFKQADEDDDILVVRRSAPVIEPHRLRPEISIKLSRFIMRMLQDAASERPDYEEITAELKVFRNRYKKHEDKFHYRFIAKHL